MSAREPRDHSGFDLRGTAWIVSVVRTIGAVVCLALAAIGWETLGGAKLAALLSLAIALASLQARLLLRGDRLPRSVAVGPSLLLAVLCEAIAIACTGGIDSPIVIATLPLSIMVGFLGGSRWRGFPLVLVVMVWGFFGAEFVPPLSGLLAEPTLGATRTLASQSVFVAVLTFILVGGNRIGRAARGMLDATNESLARAQEARLEELARSHEELRSLTRTLAHELKNPLTTLLSLGTHLHRTLPPSLTNGETSVLVEELRRMRQIVARMLGAPASGAHATAVDLLGLCGRVRETHAAIASDLGVSVEVMGMPARVRGSERELTTVLENLLQNALEATPRGKRISLAVSASGSSARVEVRDEGHGLEDGVRELLFSRGFTTKSDGHGIGLAISRSIVEQHGGRLEILDQRGHGCAARVDLPIEADR